MRRATAGIVRHPRRGRGAPGTRAAAHDARWRHGGKARPQRGEGRAEGGGVQLGARCGSSDGTRAAAAGRSAVRRRRRRRADEEPPSCGSRRTRSASSSARSLSASAASAARSRCTSQRSAGRERRGGPHGGRRAAVCTGTDVGATSAFAAARTENDLPPPATRAVTVNPSAVSNRRFGGERHPPPPVAKGGDVAGSAVPLTRTSGGGGGAPSWRCASIAACRATTRSPALEGERLRRQSRRAVATAVLDARCQRRTKLSSLGGGRLPTQQALLTLGQHAAPQVRKAAAPPRRAALGAHQLHAARQRLGGRRRDRAARGRRRQARSRPRPAPEIARRRDVGRRYRRRHVWRAVAAALSHALVRSRAIPRSCSSPMSGFTSRTSSAIMALPSPSLHSRKARSGASCRSV